MSECTESKKKLAEGLAACGKAIEALGDETRIRIVLSLLEGEEGGMRVGEIAQKTHLSRPSVSRQLRVLSGAGLVSVYKAGTKSFYYMDANVALWEKLASLFADVYETVKIAADEGYPVPCPIKEREE